METKWALASSQRQPLVPIQNQINTVHNIPPHPTSCKNRLMHILFTSLYQCSVALICFGPQRTIFMEHDLQIFTARSTKYVPEIKFSLLSSVTLLDKVNFTLILHLVYIFVALAVKKYLLYSLKMALGVSKHVRLTEC